MDTASPLIVFIHGLSLNEKCWEPIKPYFESRGFVCHSPSYPFHNGEPAQLRSNPDPQLGKLTFDQVVDMYEGYVSALPQKPVLIGHSMGGLIVQKLMEKKLGAAGICICSAPPPGIFTFKWSFIKYNFPMINPLKGDSICMASPRGYHKAVCNTMSIDETTTAYNKYVVPESRNIPRKPSKVNFAAVEGPMLFIAAEKDKIVPSELNRRNHAAYKLAGKKSEYKEFPGRSHFILWQNKQGEVLQFVNEWITANLPITTK